MEPDPVATETATPPLIHPGMNLALGLAGALVGGALGFFLVSWLARQGFYGVALPGVMMGVGAGMLAKRPSLPLAILCGVMALALGVFTEWKLFPFIKDGSFSYFLAHLSDLKQLTLLMIGLGAVGGAWFAWRSRPPKP